MVRMGDLADLLVEGVADAGGGGALRLAWSQGQNVGMLTTGGFIIAGAVLPMFLRSPITDIVTRGMFHSGATIGGWVATEKVFKLAALPASDVQPPLNPGGSRRQLGPGSYRAAHNGARVPEVALHGLNPNTGEPILDSAI